ncbi:hypothetical protein [Ekhidna sp.]
MIEKKRKDVKVIGRRMKKAKAKDWVKKYQKENPDATFGWLYGRDIIESLCSNKSLEGIWFFKGINEDGKERLVLFPADKEGNILDTKMKSLGAAVTKDGGLDDNPADDGDTCPPKCPEGLG